MRKKGMHALVGAMNAKDDQGLEDDDIRPERAPNKTYHCYKRVNEVDDLIRTAISAISAVIVDRRLGVVCKILGTLRFIPLAKGELSSSKMGYHYFLWTGKITPANPNKAELLVPTNIQAVCLMLPRLQSVHLPVRYSSEARSLLSTLVIV